MLAVRRSIRQPWFQLFDLVCVSAAGLTWCFQRQVVWWPLLLALLPGLIRVSCGAYACHRTRFDVPLLIFLVTAGVGVWAAYDRQAAWLKFWVIVAAVLCFQALARQPDENFRLITGLLGLVGAGIAVSFLLIHDWGSYPADFHLLDRFGRWFMSVRPELSGGHWFHPNQAGGILAILLPYSLAFGAIAWQKYRAMAPKPRIAGFAGVYAIIVVALIFFGLLMTSSRGAWLATAAAFGMWLGWMLSRPFTRRARRILAIGLAVALLLIGVILVGLAYENPGGVLRQIDQLPGEASGASRYALASNTLQLVGDFPLTGGGLDAFAGLYSYYLMVIPNFLFSYSHNLYLDVALEQGLIGLLALLFVLLGSVFMLVRKPGEPVISGPSYWLKQAVLISLLVLLMHGMVDDALYGNRGTSLLYLSAGLATAISQPPVQELPGNRTTLPVTMKTWNRNHIAVFFALAIVVAAFGLSSKQLKAVWMANLGAVRMAQAQLRDFPSDEWENGGNMQILEVAEQELNRSLVFDPLNGTANYRLGLLAMLRRDFSAADIYLQAALEQRKGHRGIIKNLGYNHVWLGEYDQAAEMLEQIPEAARELESYAWWWRAQGRGDLARHAQSMRAHMKQIRGVH